MAIVESADPSLKWFGLDAAALGNLDYSGADTLRQIAAEHQRRSTRLVVWAVDPAIRTLLHHYDLTATIGTEYIFGTVDELIDAYRATTT